MFMVMSRIWAAPQPRAKIHVWRCFGSSDRLLNLGIGPITPPPAFAVSLPGTESWVLAHPRNGPPKRSLYQISRIVLETEIR